MSGAALHVFLLLCVAAATVYWTGAEVIAPVGLVAEVERPLLLSCNVTFGPGSTLVQVRWYDSRQNKLLAYQLPSSSISHQDDNVQLVESRTDGSSIRIVELRPDSGGCYRCAFDIFPSGEQEGKACIELTGRLHHDGNKTAVSGQQLTLSCRYSLPDQVLQVLWRRSTEEGQEAKITTMAWFARGDAQSSVEQAFQGRVNLSASLGHSHLTLLHLRPGDQACYTCKFNTFPGGTKSATSCLTVNVLPQIPQLTLATSPSGDTEVNCTTHSRPPAQLTWEVGRANTTLGPPTITWRKQSDGTWTVTSTLLLRLSEAPGRAAATCVVRHPGLQVPLRATLDPPPSNHAGSSMMVVLVLCAAAGILLIGLLVCVCRCLCCTKE